VCSCVISRTYGVAHTLSHCGKGIVDTIAVEENLSGTRVKLNTANAIFEVTAKPELGLEIGADAVHCILRHVEYSTGIVD
jgi:hypothetical protein